MPLLSLVLSLSQTIISAEGQETPKVSLLTRFAFALCDSWRFKNTFETETAQKLVDMFHKDSIKRPSLLKQYFPMIYSLEQLEEHYKKVRNKKDFEHITCAWALKDVYYRLAQLEYRQSKNLPTFIQENKEKLASFGLLYFRNLEDKLLHNYPAGFFNGWEPEETETNLHDLTLSRAEIAATWKMIK